jgi:hypothetical protein
MKILVSLLGRKKKQTQRDAGLSQKKHGRSMRETEVKYTMRKKAFT